MSCSCWAPSSGSWSSRWTPSRRRLAEKPISRRAGRLPRPFPMLKSQLSLMVVCGPQRFAFLVVLLDAGVLVVGVQAGGDTVGDHPGAEPGLGAPFPAAVDAASEDQPDLVCAAHVEVVADDMFEEDPPVTGASSIWVRENSACRIETS